MNHVIASMINLDYNYYSGWGATHGAAHASRQLRRRQRGPQAAQGEAQGFPLPLLKKTLKVHSRLFRFTQPWTKKNQISHKTIHCKWFQEHLFGRSCTQRVYAILKWAWNAKLRLDLGPLLRGIPFAWMAGKILNQVSLEGAQAALESDSRHRVLPIVSEREVGYTYNIRDTWNIILEGTELFDVKQLRKISQAVARLPKFAYVIPNSFNCTKGLKGDTNFSCCWPSVDWVHVHRLKSSNLHSSLALQPRLLDVMCHGFLHVRKVFVFLYHARRGFLTRRRICRPGSSTFSEYALRIAATGSRVTGAMSSCQAMIWPGQTLSKTWGFPSQFIESTEVLIRWDVQGGK